jgi:hypothetical protein
MARKKIGEPKYYIYYDEKSGEITSVTNERRQNHKNGIEITYAMHDALVSGQEKFSDYSIGRVKTDDGKTVLTVMPKSDQAYIFKNTMLELISDTPNKDTELIVEWDPANKHWMFLLTDIAKKRIGDSLKDSTLIFFVTLEEDFNFLIRTMLVSYQDLLLKSNVFIPFEYEIESNIDKISLATKITLESYGLKIND